MPHALPGRHPEERAHPHHARRPLHRDGALRRDLHRRAGHRGPWPPSPSPTSAASSPTPRTSGAAPPTSGGGRCRRRRRPRRPRRGDRRRRLAPPPPDPRPVPPRDGHPEHAPALRRVPHPDHRRPRCHGRRRGGLVYKRSSYSGPGHGARAGSWRKTDPFEDAELVFVTVAPRRARAGRGRAARRRRAVEDAGPPRSARARLVPRACSRSLRASRRGPSHARGVVRAGGSGAPGARGRRLRAVTGAPHARTCSTPPWRSSGRPGATGSTAPARSAGTLSAPAQSPTPATRGRPRPSARMPARRPSTRRRWSGRDALPVGHGGQRPALPRDRARRRDRRGGRPSGPDRRRPPGGPRASSRPSAASSGGARPSLHSATLLALAASHDQPSVRTFAAWALVGAAGSERGAAAVPEPSGGSSTRRTPAPWCGSPGPWPPRRT